MLDWEQGKAQEPEQKGEREKKKQLHYYDPFYFMAETFLTAIFPYLHTIFHLREI